MVLLFSRLHPLSEAYTYFSTNKKKHHVTLPTTFFFFLSFFFTHFVPYNNSCVYLYRVRRVVCKNKNFFFSLQPILPAVCLACIQKKVALRLFPISSTGRGRPEKSLRAMTDEWVFLFLASPPFTLVSMCVSVCFVCL